jgi:bifunctional enzyme Fae/Hps
VHVLKTLDNPPYLQVALDNPDMESMKKVVSKLPRSDRVIIEAGTPLIKRYGSDAIIQLRKVRDCFIVADLKTLDVGALEVTIAYEAGADAAVVSGLAFPLTVKEFIEVAKKMEMCSFVDMMNVPDPLKALRDSGVVPDAVLLHRGIDSESVAKHSWNYLKEVKEKLAGKALIGVGGGIELELAKKSIENGADIIIVGRYITNSQDVAAAANSILKLMG